ncbi:ferredoxin [Candidatus Roizmanbacteria bacterium CG10_big_fil_rev_8_21_14_0_10_39_6]|uniref:Ferredoxin n=1 Tax=Candidatus Roizmanbacteria bacterium CG10_big_fil_rev_8_21_14_0_10_39_6 TaxID=1974853 RepID=A0A2M8KSB1_9BACT|nr:MAG: ferredoxin [Candidatus Roizmanbacteria bacterium CG10_big_fil_rev_8_21_14_0_10_39_6]
MGDKHTNNSSKKNAWKVWVDRDLCIGVASCVAVAPSAFSLDNEAKAVVLDTIDQEQKETILDAARACPVAAIFIEEIKSGKRIFPK